MKPYMRVWGQADQARDERDDDCEVLGCYDQQQCVFLTNTGGDSVDNTDSFPNNTN